MTIIWKYDQAEYAIIGKQREKYELDSSVILFQNLGICSFSRAKRIRKA